MFFYASKIIWFLTAPSTLLMAIVCLGAILLFTRFLRAGRILVALGALGFLIFGSSPVPRLMIRELERRFPPMTAETASARPVDGIIVLGGALDYRRGQMRPFFPCQCLLPFTLIFRSRVSSSLAST